MVALGMIALGVVALGVVGLGVVGLGVVALGVVAFRMVGRSGRAENSLATALASGTHERKPRNEQHRRHELH